MMQHATRESVAYDYARFDNRRVVRQAVEAAEMQQKKPKAKKKKAVMPSLVLSLFAVFLFSGIIVYNYMQVTMLADQASKLEKELTNLKSDEVSMRAEQEKMFNLNYIEDYAKNNLDMVKADEAQIDYIQLSEPDQIQVLNGKNLASGYFSGFIKTFNVVVEYLN